MTTSRAFVGPVVAMVFLGKDAEVAELVDALDLGSSVLRRESSSLSFRTILEIMVEHSLSMAVKASKVSLERKHAGFRRNDFRPRKKAERQRAFDSGRYSG